jgi:hypothetical protein
MKKGNKLFVVLAATLLVLGSGGVAQVKADQILGGLPGLSVLTSVITFDELGAFPIATPITNQFSAFGATFSGFGWDNATLGQAGSTGFSGGNLVNGIVGFPGGAAIISFSQQVTGAAFAAVDQGGLWLVEAFLGGVGGTLVDSFALVIPFNPGIGFIGFENLDFDTIRLTTLGSAALSIDNLQIKVPEPGTFLLLGMGLLAMGAGLRRKRSAA